MKPEFRFHRGHLFYFGMAQVLASFFGGINDVRRFAG
jgi:hypothetical protein